ncbi:MAG: hypothetical protein WEB06_16100 [Actinomycetota bacterium]
MAAVPTREAVWRAAGPASASSPGPVGVYVIRDDQVEWQPAVDLSRLIGAGAVVASLAILTLRTAIRKRSRRPR